MTVAGNEVTECQGTIMWRGGASYGRALNSRETVRRYLCVAFALFVSSKRRFLCKVPLGKTRSSKHSRVTSSIDMKPECSNEISRRRCEGVSFKAGKLRNDED